MRSLLSVAAAAVVVSVATLVLAHGAAVVVGHNYIEPAEITIAVGEIVHFQNRDEMPGGHTIVADDGAFESPALGKGEGWHYTFSKSGVYSYHVKEHPGTVGKIVVVEAPPSSSSQPSLH